MLLSILHETVKLPCPQRRVFFLSHAYFKAFHVLPLLRSFRHILCQLLERLASHRDVLLQMSSQVSDKSLLPVKAEAGMHLPA
jgi:hypothetical protein